MNSISRIQIVSIAALAAAVLFLTSCTTSGSKGWHRPARAGERVGQVMEVDGARVAILIDESCLVHSGDVLSVKRLVCEPGAGRRDTKGCRVSDSGTVTVDSVNTDDHIARGRIYEGSAAPDAPVFMTDSSLSGRLSTH